MIDQIRECGVLKAVGAGSMWVTRLVVGETIYRAVIGYTIGIGLAYLAAGAIMSAWPQINIVFRIDSILQTGGLVIVMTVIAALLPLQHLKKIDPLIVFKA